jgi:hypothetical protein
MANLRYRIPWQTESLFAENHEAFFNSIDPKETLWTANYCIARGPPDAALRSVIQCALRSAQLDSHLLFSTLTYGGALQELNPTDIGSETLSTVGNIATMV